MTNTDVFLSRYPAAAEALHGPLSETAGVPSAALDQAEARLGFALPATLRSYYALAGRLPINAAYNRLLAPHELRVTQDGALVFYEAHQGVVSWGIPAQALSKADPQVHQCHDEQEPLWSSERAALSGFLFKQLFVQSAEALPVVHRGSMSAETVAALRAEWSPVVDDDDGVFFQEPGLLLALDPREEMTIADGEPVTKRWAVAHLYEAHAPSAESDWRSAAPPALLAWVDAPATDADEPDDAEFYELVPSLAGLDEAAARRAVEELGFHLGVSSEGETHPDVPAGAVLRQEPAAGDQLLTGRAVKVVCSLGPDEVFLPSLEGKTVAEARSFLDLLGFRLGAVRGEGATVASSEPAGGISAPRGAEVDVTLGD